MAFEKGKSGNPGGRPKSTTRVQELAREHTEAALGVLVDVLHDPDASAPARVSAANAILDRGHGKPPQFSTGDAQRFRSALEMTDDELAAIAAGSGQGITDAEDDPPVTH